MCSQFQGGEMFVLLDTPWMAVGPLFLYVPVIRGPLLQVKSVYGDEQAVWRFSMGGSF